MMATFNWWLENDSLANKKVLGLCSQHSSGISVQADAIQLLLMLACMDVCENTASMQV